MAFDKVLIAVSVAGQVKGCTKCTDGEKNDRVMREQEEGPEVEQGDHIGTRWQGSQV